MKNFVPFVFLALAGVLGCSSSQPPPDAVPITEVHEDPTPAPSSSQTAEAPPSDATPLAEEPPKAEEPAGGGGRLAFQSCTEDSRLVKGCTRDMQPVCAEVDTGIRCIKAPCPSTMQRTYLNACMACVEKNVRGVWPMACEDMQKSGAP